MIIFFAMTPTTPPQHNQFSFKPQQFILFLLTIFLLGCSAEEEEFDEGKNLPLKETLASTSTYKGIFASQNSTYRGIVKITLPGGKKDLQTLNTNAVAIITLQTGESFEAKAVQLKGSDFKVFFESEDLSFNFTVDETNTPRITDVVFKKETSSIIAAEETVDSPVNPVTGTYKCTNCQDQNTSVNGIELNNQERTFNMLLTTKDEKTSLSLQAVVGMLVDTKLLVNETCTINDQFTYCYIKGGENLTTEPITWTGVHRYTSEGSTGVQCSSISGIFKYSSGNLGSIEGEFKSDMSCPNNTYFVSSSGNDANTGLSPQDPWKSITKINSIDLKPGDQVLFEGNNEYPGNLYLDSRDGNNSANTVKISSYGTGKATIKAGSSYGIYAYNTAGFLVDNLIISGSGMASNTNSGIYFYNDLAGDVKLDLVEITNCEVFGFKDFGIVIGAWNGNSGFSNVLIENNKVHDILDVGISSFGHFSSTKTGYAHSNLTVRNCEVFNIVGYSKKSHSGNGIVLSDVQNSIIEHCTVYNSGSGNTNCGGPVGIWYWDADNVTIQFSEAYNISSGTGCDGGGFDMDGGVTNGIMQYNYSHDNDGAGFLVGQFTGARPMANITVRYNISQNDAATNGGSIYLFNGSSTTSMKDIYVYNNTLYIKEKSTNTQSAAIKLLQWKTINQNVNFYNNILFTENGSSLVEVPTGYSAKFQGNIYHSTSAFLINYNGTTYNSLSAFRQTGNEIFDNSPVGFQGDPKLTNPGQGGIVGFGNLLSGLSNYKILDDSPAVNSGINFNLEAGTRDFYGNILSQSSIKDSGAHENSTVANRSSTGIANK